MRLHQRVSSIPRHFSIIAQYKFVSGMDSSVNCNSRIACFVIEIKQNRICYVLSYFSILPVTITLTLLSYQLQLHLHNYPTSYNYTYTIILIIVVHI